MTIRSMRLTTHKEANQKGKTQKRNDVHKLAFVRGSCKTRFGDQIRVLPQPR
jgi:hypothetical protein